MHLFVPRALCDYLVLVYIASRSFFDAAPSSYFSLVIDSPRRSFLDSLGQTSFVILTPDSNLREVSLHKFTPESTPDMHGVVFHGIVKIKLEV